MRSSRVGIAILWLSASGASLAGPPIAPDQRVTAEVVGTLASPDPKPLSMPTDVAIDGAGRIFVADGVNDRIVRFTKAGQLDGEIRGAGGQTLRRPVGLTCDAKDRLWSADSGHRRVLVIGADGSLVEVVDAPKAEDGAAFDPTDVAVKPDGKRTYVADNDNHRVWVRDNATKEWTSLGKFGMALGQFQWPFMLCIAREDYVYVSEAIGARVQRISPTDRWAGQLGKWGVQVGTFYRPKGVAADAQGRLFVSDSTLRVVQAFNERGRFIGVLTDAQGQPLRFAHPMGLCFDAEGFLYVVELDANRVAKVKLSEMKEEGR